MNEENKVQTWWLEGKRRWRPSRWWLLLKLVASLKKAERRSWKRRRVGRKGGKGRKRRKRKKSGKMAKVGKKCKTDTTTTTVFELCLDHRGPDICQNDHEKEASWLILDLDQRSDWVGNKFENSWLDCQVVVVVVRTRGCCFWNFDQRCSSGGGGLAT